jgi:hypothetical protein
MPVGFSAAVVAAFVVATLACFGVLPEWLALTPVVVWVLAGLVIGAVESQAKEAA